MCRPEKTSNFSSKAKNVMENWQKVPLVWSPLILRKMLRVARERESDPSHSAPTQLLFTRTISSSRPCRCPLLWKWPSPPTRAPATTTTTFPRSSCLTKNSPRTLPRRPTLPTLRRERICPRPRRRRTNVRNAANASSIIRRWWSTGASTAACSLTTAPSAGGLSERPLCWPATGCASARTPPTCASNAATAFPHPWTNSDTTARSGGAPTIAATAERRSKSRAA